MTDDMNNNKKTKVDVLSHFFNPSQSAQSNCFNCSTLQLIWWLEPPIRCTSTTERFAIQRYCIQIAYWNSDGKQVNCANTTTTKNNEKKYHRFDKTVIVVICKVHPFPLRQFSKSIFLALLSLSNLCLLSRRSHTTFSLSLFSFFHCLCARKTMQFHCDFNVHALHYLNVSTQIKCHIKWPLLLLFFCSSHSNT